jgi:flagellar protein FlaI
MHFAETKLKKLEGGIFADIYQGLSHNFYDLKPVPLSEKEKKLADLLIIEIQKGSSHHKEFEEVKESFFEEFYEKIVSVVELNGLNSKLASKNIFSSLVESLAKLVSVIGFVKDEVFFASYVLHNAVGLKQLAFFSLDDGLEELMVNSPTNIFVFHKLYGMCKTNVSLSDKDLANVTHKIAFTIGKEFDQKNSLLDARLPDGSRVNATIGELSPNGASLTIRKFSSVPLTILDLVENGTLPFDAAAFLWLMVDGLGEYPKNILITGGTASGKTTFLNVLSNFIRPSERIVSIEDTIELSLFGRENWVPLEARTASEPEVTMDSLLKNSMRMRPDRIIVGEVRGSEALTLFTAMDTGHQGCLGTIHANNARETLVKLQERPLSVPQSMLPLLDFIIVMRRHYSKESGMQRRVTQIVELSRMEDKVLSGVLFDFDEATSRLFRTEMQSRVIEDLAIHNALTKNDLKKEIEARKRLLQWMIAQNIRKPLEVLEVIVSYYYNPEKVLSTISELS